MYILQEDCGSCPTTRRGIPYPVFGSSLAVCLLVMLYLSSLLASKSGQVQEFTQMYGACRQQVGINYICTIFGLHLVSPTRSESACPCHCKVDPQLTRLPGRTSQLNAMKTEVSVTKDELIGLQEDHYSTESQLKQVCYTLHRSRSMDAPVCRQGSGCVLDDTLCASHSPIAHRDPIPRKMCYNMTLCNAIQYGSWLLRHTWKDHALFPMQHPLPGHRSHTYIEPPLPLLPPLAYSNHHPGAHHHAPPWHPTYATHPATLSHHLTPSHAS